jgi:creatinine amidohydrolase
VVAVDRAATAVPETVNMAHDFRWLSAIRPVGFGWMTQDLHASGAVGDAAGASAEKGEAALAHGARAFVELLRDVDRFDLKRLRDGPLGGAAADTSI